MVDGLTARDQGWVENGVPRGFWPGLSARELWGYRELVLVLAARDVRLRYRQTYFGVAWVLLQPLVGVAVLSVVFGRLAAVPHDGIPYPVFVLAGLATWTLFSSGVERGAQSLVDQPHLVTKIYLPRILVPFGALMPGVLDFAVTVAALLPIFMIVHGVAPGPELLLLPLWIAWTLLVTLGVALWFAALNVRYRDVRHTLGFVVQAWFLASPVLFSPSVYEGAAKYAFALNPMLSAIDGCRWALLSAPAPQLADLISMACGAVVLVTGTIYFQRSEVRFADVV